MQDKVVTFSKEAREKVLAGMNLAADAVKVTLGPKGRNVLIEQIKGAAPHSTKDGVTVAREIKLEDAEQNLGAALIREVAMKQNEHSGDGTTTATVLTQSIVNQGNKVITAGANPMDVKRGIDKAVTKIVDTLKSLKKDVTTSDEIAQIGTISANGEYAIGKIIADAMDKVGKEGVITIEQSGTLETTLDVVEGMQFNQGYMSAHFITDAEKLKVELENPYILFLNSKLKTLPPLLPVLESVVTADRSLLMVVEDIDAETLATLVVNKMRGSIRICVVKAPGYGSQRTTLLEDMAALTGGEVISEDISVKLENVTVSMLGKARKVVITQEDTTIIGGQPNEEKLFDRQAQIRLLLKDASGDMEKLHLEHRLAKLTGGVAVIRVGGATEMEVKERKDRVEDALNATKAAVEEGIVGGGGTALFYAANKVRATSLTSDNEDRQFGINIVLKACEAPLRQIAENAGIEGTAVITELNRIGDLAQGYDAQTGQYVFMYEAGIIDPVKVVRTALQDAASVASLLLTTEATITIKKDE